jgi:SAM-dependent methyltransferase
VAEGPHPERASTCTACGGARFTERRPLPDLVTRTCDSCGLIFGSARRTEPVVGEFALVDHEGYLRSVGRTRRIQARAMLRWLRPLVPPNSSVLDVGCSFGFFLVAAREAGFRVSGLEPDPQATAFARRVLGDGVVRQGMLEPGRVRAGSADVVATLDVLEHIDPNEHASFARAVRETLTPGGIWLIKVPAVEGLYYRSSELLTRVFPRVGGTLLRRLWQTRYEYPHLVYFSRPSLTRWLDRFGFDPVSHRYVPEVPPGTIVDRLTTDGDIGRVAAYAAAPALLAVNLVETVRRRSDSLVVFARPRP